MIESIISGENRRKVVCLNATPGAGKSMIPLISGKLIESGLADKICWVVPRKALQSQGEAGFQDPFFREKLGHDLSIRTSTNDVDPCRGLDGFATTYQAVGMDNEILRFEFARNRYILILDEFHHVALDGKWHQAIEPLFTHAEYIILMTGTMERGDQKEIAYTRCDMEVIHYTREDAYRDRAILPVEFHLLDGKVEFSSASTGRMCLNSFKAAGGNKSIASKALFTALNTEFAFQLLQESVAHWSHWRAKVNPGAQLLLVTVDYKHANDVLGWLRAKNIPSDIATSHETAKAIKAIRRFKAGEIPALVSIAMAYEGLDVPSVSHIASLTRIRSAPWIIQMIARAVRIDKALPYEQQVAHIFSPADPLMQSIVDQIRADETNAKAPEEGTRKKKQLKMFEQDEKEPDIIPINGKMTGKNSKVWGFHGTPAAGRIETPGEKEARIRKEIESHVRQFAFVNRYKNGRINGEIKKHFGKSRDHMTLRELERCLDHVRATYPLGGGPDRSPAPRVSGGGAVSRRRGTGRRVTSKVVPFSG